MVNVFRRVAAVLLVLLARTSPRGAKVTIAASARDLSTEQLQTEEKQDTSAAAPQVEGGGAGEGPHHIKYISLIAERHSGSTWMTGFLNRYFRHSDVKVTPTLCTWKHWFQDRIHQDIQDGKRPCREHQMCPACLDPEHTLVVAMWRNPYDWISGMQFNPHHAKAHRGVQDLSEFMTMPWIMQPEVHVCEESVLMGRLQVVQHQYDEADNNQLAMLYGLLRVKMMQNEECARKDALMKAKEELPCIDNFLPEEVLPCKENDRSSIYELDRDGHAYGNIYELRKAKILDFSAVETWVPFYEKIAYEDMLVGERLRDWLRSLETKYGLVGNYIDVPGSALEDSMAHSRSRMYYTNSEHCAPNCTMGGVAGATAVETLHQMWDEDLESRVGYHKVNVQGTS